MTTKMWSRLPGILLTVVLMVSLGVGVWLDQNGPQWPKAIEMMKILPSEDVSVVMYQGFSGRFGAAYRDEIVFEGLDEFCGQDINAVHGKGLCSFQGYYDNVESSPNPSEKLALYEGQFDGASMARALEADGEFAPASRLGRILVWTSIQGHENATIALIDQWIVSGPTERVQQCVEAAQGKRESLYHNRHARDVLNRLPKGDYFVLAAGLRLDEDEPGRLAWTECWHFATSNSSPSRSTTVEKYGNIDSATSRISRLRSESQGDPAGFKVSQDGLFVTYTKATNRY
jgi:hypothetical protein